MSNSKSAIFVTASGILLIYLFFAKYEIDLKLSIFTCFTAIGALITLLSSLFHQLKTTITKPYYFAPEQFEQCFKEVAVNSLKKVNTKNKYNFLSKNNDGDNNFEKLIIVIDNIDRCHSDTAYQLLTDIKTFLGSQDLSIVFVIPVDDKAILKQFFLKNDNKYNNHKDKEEFLRKIFNVTLRIKPYNETDMFSFTKGINGKNRLGFKNETINIISKEYSSNPRRVIQLMNNLISELNNYNQEFSNKNETLICCILIIREEYPEFYDMTIKNASLLLNDGNSIDFTNIENKDTIEDIKRFMRIAGAEFKNCDVSILNKVLMNTDNLFDDVPPEVAEMINTFDSDKLVKHIEENTAFNHDTYKYLGHKIDEASKNRLIKDLAQYLELAGALNKISPIPTEYAFRIYEIFKDKIESIFFNCINPEILLSLIEYEDSHLKRYSLKKLIIDKVKSNVNSTDETSKIKWMQILDSLIENFKDKDTCITLSEYYTGHYHNLKDFINFNETQFEYLINEEFIKARIAEFNTIDLEGVEYNRIKILFENISNKPFLLTALFAKIEASTNIFSDPEKDLKLISLVHNLLELIIEKNIIYENPVLEKVINKIFSDDLFADERNNASPVIDANKSNHSVLISFLNFFTDYYKVSKNISVLDNYFWQLSKFIPKEVKQSMIDLKNQGVDIIKLYPVVKKDYDYSDPNTIQLLKYFLTYNNDENQIIDIVEKKTKISELITDIDKEYSKDINSLLIYLSNFDLFYAEIIGRTIILKSKIEALNYISPELKKLAVKYFEHNDKINYIDPKFMDFVFDYGDNRLKDIYVDKINSNLVAFNNVIEILDSCLLIFSKKKDEELKKQIIEKIKLFKEKYSQKLKSKTPVNKKINDKLDNLI